MPSAARTTGLRTLEVAEAAAGVSIPTRLVYPSLAETAPVRLGPYSLDVAKDGAVDGETLPLVLVSHGKGGTGLVYRELAMRLALEGFVVALVDHPGDCRHDDRLSGTAENLENRPRHLRRVLDAVVADETLGPRLSRDGAFVIGHSMGGYTALALAGGRPTAFTNETSDGKPRAVTVVPDPRVRALVLLAPATAWYMLHGSLENVDLPILMRSAERDEHTPPGHADLVMRGVRDSSKVSHAVVPSAGHFAFLTPFPPSMTSAGFAPSQDPPGFDRAAFQQTLASDIARFFRAVLSPESRAP